MRIGQMLVQQGVLSQAQVDEALAEQADSGRPLGLICEQRYGVDPAIIERLWATQYAMVTERIDAAREPVDAAVANTITASQAWRYRVLPLRIDDDGTLVMTTTERDLARALRFTTRVLSRPVYFLLTDAASLEQALMQRFPQSAQSGPASARRVTSA